MSSFSLEHDGVATGFVVFGEGVDETFRRGADEAGHPDDMLRTLHSPEELRAAVAVDVAQVALANTYQQPPRLVA